MPKIRKICQTPLFGEFSYYYKYIKIYACVNIQKYICVNNPSYQGGDIVGRKEIYEGWVSYSIRAFVLPVL